jgi:acyl-coenzyme A thioesterase PaaI-like protein
MALSHHDLCFGCGLANVFGLQLELERRDDGSVSGRFFVKQDHQGPPGVAHGGIVAAALDEAGALAAGDEAHVAITVSLHVDFQAPAPVGDFVALDAGVEREEGDRRWVTAVARSREGAELATGRGQFVRRVV